MANYSTSSSNDPNRASRLEFAGVVGTSEDKKKVIVTFDGDVSNTIEIIKTSAFTPRDGESCAVLIQGNRMIAIGAISDYVVAAQTRSLDYSIGKVLTAETDVFRWYNKTGARLYFSRVWASFAANSTVTFDINRNGTTIFTSPTKLVLSSATNAVLTSTAMTQTYLEDGDYLTIDVDSVSGSPQYGIVSIDLSTQ
jgi:hypothetical protein